MCLAEHWQSMASLGSLPPCLQVCHPACLYCGMCLADRARMTHAVNKHHRPDSNSRFCAQLRLRCYRPGQWGVHGLTHIRPWHLRLSSINATNVCATRNASISWHLPKQRPQRNSTASSDSHIAMAPPLHDCSRSSWMVTDRNSVQALKAAGNHQERDALPIFNWND